LKVYGKLIKETRIIKEAAVEELDENIPYRDMLEQCLIKLCKQLDIQVPLWLKKNTKEFNNFHWTSFSNEQFYEKVKFDRLDIKVE
jgi:hypothetical protein